MKLVESSWGKDLVHRVQKHKYVLLLFFSVGILLHFH